MVDTLAPEDASWKDATDVDAATDIEHHDMHVGEADVFEIPPAMDVMNSDAEPEVSDTEPEVPDADPELPDVDLEVADADLELPDVDLEVLDAPMDADPDLPTYDCGGLQQPYYHDEDGDELGDPDDSIIACDPPEGYVIDHTDNCPSVYNPDQADTDEDGVGDVCPARTGDCGDITEGNLLLHWTWGYSDLMPTTTLSVLRGADALLGDRALRAVTTAGYDFWLRYDTPEDTVINVSDYQELRLAVRALNTTQYGWQGNFPVVVLEDATGQRRIYTPTSQLIGTDGVEWRRVVVPLAGGTGWTLGGQAVDFATIRAIETHFDTWDFGFRVDLDAMSFETTAHACPCPRTCSGHGDCLGGSFECTCDLGFAGQDCSDCAEGFSGPACSLTLDGSADVWPNDFSNRNSDPWIVVHHEDIRRVEPKVLVLVFANLATPAWQTSLLDQVKAAFVEASRTQGFADDDAPAQIAYDLRVVDLRDGVGGRPPVGPEYPYDNSTLWPYTGSVRTSGVFDYAALFESPFTELYGVEDPDHPGSYLDLCALVERGDVHEVWVMASGDKPDAGAYEVIEIKPKYTATGNRIVGAVERCAGNGCAPADMPFCGRSVRIGFLNYTRGPGCYMESLSHGLEWAMNHVVAPYMSEWFWNFAGFDYDDRYGLPFASWYYMGCPQGWTCLSYPSKTSVAVNTGTFNDTVSPFDAICGNVHFPPNGRSDYDIDNTQVVTSSCVGFGRHAGLGGADVTSDVSRANWMPLYGSLAGDCDGPFLVWWWQNMPGYQSGQTFSDGRIMRSVWPFLYY